MRRAWFVGAARGLAFGVGANLVGLRFVPAVIARFTPLPFAVGVIALLLLSIAQAIPWAVAAMVRAALVRWAVPRPLAFALGVYAAAFVPSVFPWTPAGVVAAWPAMVQLADVVGERGVSVLIGLAAGCLAEGVRLYRAPGARRLAGIALGAGALLPAVMAGYGSFRMDAIEARRSHSPVVPVGLVEPSIPATTRWDPAEAPVLLDRLTSLTDSAELHGARLVIWPESAYPYVLPHGAPHEPIGPERMHRRGTSAPLIVGAVTQDPSGDKRNSAIGVASDGSLTEPYDKLHLLWFGEEVPLAGALPWLRRTFARGLGMVPGKAPVRVDVGEHVKAGVMICYEDTLPAGGRDATFFDPNLLVNLTNDAWFEGSAESEIHLRYSVLRAVEARRDLVRAVNLGPTSQVDAAGRVTKRYDPLAPGVLMVDAALLEGASVYSTFGDAPWVLLCGAGVYAWRRLRERRGRPQAKNGP